MIRLMIIFVGIAATFVMFFPQASDKTEHIPPSTSHNAQQWSGATTPQQIQSVENRRKIFCTLVEESKNMIRESLSPAEIMSFDLSTPEQKWSFLRAHLIEKGCPDQEVLSTSLGIMSVSDIEFGTMDGLDTCHIPQEIGVVLPLR
jgi:hypothetical protein